jgi:hypothetical protein
MTWPFSRDQTITLGIGVPGALAAIVAAIYSIRGYRFGRRQAKHLTAQRDTDIQPRLDEMWGGFRGGGLGPTPLKMMNTGGPAIHFIWVGQDDQLVAAISGRVPAHTQARQAYTPVQLGSCLDRDTCRATLLIAQDIQQRWWNCATGEQLLGTAEDYLDQRMDQMGLAHLTEQLRAVHLPPAGPP